MHAVKAQDACDNGAADLETEMTNHRVKNWAPEVAFSPFYNNLIYFCKLLTFLCVSPSHREDTINSISHCSSTSMLSFSSGLVLAFRRIPTQIDKHGFVRTLCFTSAKNTTFQDFRLLLLFVCILLFVWASRNHNMATSTKDFLTFYWLCPELRFPFTFLKFLGLEKSRYPPDFSPCSWGKCAPTHWCRGWQLRSTWEDVLWYHRLKRH